MSDTDCTFMKPECHHQKLTRNSTKQQVMHELANVREELKATNAIALQALERVVQHANEGHFTRLRAGQIQLNTVTSDGCDVCYMMPKNADIPMCDECGMMVCKDCDHVCGGVCALCLSVLLEPHVPLCVHSIIEEYAQERLALDRDYDDDW